MPSRFQKALSLASAVIACGCGTPPPQVEPPAAAMSVPRVYISARANAWHGIPRDVHRRLTPILVSIVNTSERPLYVRLDQMVLVADAQIRYALRPADIHGHIETTLGAPPYPVSGFDYAERGAYSMGGPVPAQPRQGYWQRYGTLVRTLKLPSYDMLRKALPEGTVHPGGRVSGFLYFEPLPPQIRHAGLRVRLAGDDEERSDGWVEVPVIPE